MRVSPPIPSRLAISCAFLISICSLSSSLAEEVMVFAAASLTESLQEIATQFHATSTDKIVFHLAASSLLARQIQEGAPADIFFSADEAKMDQLSRENLLNEQSRVSILSNRLAVVVPSTSKVAIRSPNDLQKLKRIALAEPATVPAGIYARQFLQQAQVWNSVKGSVIPTQNVRAALAAVESGNVDAAIVYRTDARISNKVRVAYEPGSADSPSISYSIAALRSGEEKAAVHSFLQHLRSDAALRIFEKHGFIVNRDDS